MRKTLLVGSLVTATFALTGCQSESERAAEAALASMKGRNATLWATIPQIEHSYGTGVFTQVCVAVSINDRHGNPQEVVFILVSGADDQAMGVGGEFATFSECRAEWEVG